MTEERQVEVIDERQLGRIEAVHRGFLYQHLYAAACLLKAADGKVERIVVEGDEDVELILPGRRIYVQVKTRKESLTVGDIAGFLDRVDKIRSEHGSGVRGASLASLWRQMPRRPAHSLQKWQNRPGRKTWWSNGPTGRLQKKPAFPLHKKPCPMR
jgi:hypothetical protein